MRIKRDFFLPSVTTLVLLTITWFVSCSHQVLNKRRVANNSPLAEGSEVGWETEESRGGLSEISDLSDVNAEKNLEAPSAAEPVAIPSPAPTINELEVSPSSAPLADEKKGWKSQIPEIPTQAVVHRDKKLNRFYFLRKGDSPEKLSQLIFSNPNKAKQLVSWNSGPWKPGKLIFYPSPLEPNDNKMVSFYAESKVVIEEYKVEEGESLSRISNKLLGDYLSWKELAVVNGLQEPDLLKAGTVLGYYPQDLSKKQAKPTADNSKPKNLARAPETKTPEAQAAQTPNPPPSVMDSPTPVVTPPPVAPPARPVQAQMPKQQRPNNPRPPKPPVGWTQKVIGFFQSLWSDTTYWISEFSSDFSRQPSSKKRKK